MLASLLDSVPPEMRWTAGIIVLLIALLHAVGRFIKTVQLSNGGKTKKKAASEPIVQTVAAAVPGNPPAPEPSSPGLEQQQPQFPPDLWKAHDELMVAVSDMLAGGLVTKPDFTELKNDLNKRLDSWEKRTGKRLDAQAEQLGEISRTVAGHGATIDMLKQKL